MAGDQGLTFRALIQPLDISLDRRDKSAFEQKRKRYSEREATLSKPSGWVNIPFHISIKKERERDHSYAIHDPIEPN